MFKTVAEAQYAITGAVSVNLDQQDHSLGKSGIEHDKQRRNAFVGQWVIVLGVKRARES